MNRRLVSFGVVTGLAVTLAIGAVVQGMQRAQSQRRPTSATAQDRALDFATVRSQPHIAFRSTALGPTFGSLGVVPLDRPDGPRAVTDVACERVYATKERGVCLAADPGIVPAYYTILLDAALAPAGELPLSGLPSRTRLSPGSGMAATTTFVAGHSYAQAGFSTLTTVRDAVTGQGSGDLEDFRVLRDGKVYRSADLNMWGVTFADEDRFYVTVASSGHTWLAEGSLSRRELRTMRENVECPALSPDHNRIAYKYRVDPGVWRLHVLDLRTGADVELAESRSVDDQVEWLDDGRVLYGMPRKGSAETDIWVVPADGSGSPAVLIPHAWSPAVVH